MQGLIDSRKVIGYVNGLRNASIRKIESRQFPFKNPHSLSTPALSIIYYSDISQHRSESLNQFIDFQNWVEKPFEKSPTLLKESVNLLEIVWPELHKFNLELNPVYIEPIDGEYESASDPKRFGLIEVRQKRKGIYPLAEILAHELAHHYLFILSSIPVQTQIQWEKQIYSSIKKMNRPLIGLLHGTYAQSFMAILAKKIESHFPNDNAAVEWVKSVKSRFRSGFSVDITNLKQEGALSVFPEVQTAISEAKAWFDSDTNSKT